LASYRLSALRGRGYICTQSTQATCGLVPGGAGRTQHDTASRLRSGKPGRGELSTTVVLYRRTVAADGRFATVCMYVVPSYLVYSDTCESGLLLRNEQQEAHCSRNKDIHLPVRVRKSVPAPALSVLLLGWTVCEAEMQPFGPVPLELPCAPPPTTLMHIDAGLCRVLTTT
jgi:hypothetical protein